MSNLITKYRKLNEIEHILARPFRYIGSATNIEDFVFVIQDDKAVWRNVTYNPGLLKIFDEVITNSADFSKTAEGKHLNRIEVTLSKLTGEISVYDNGGIPVVKHPEYDQYIPDMIFGELRSGSNFNDDEESTGAGQNGEGATLTMVFSKRFQVDTADGKNRFVKNYLENGQDREEEKINRSSMKHTRITFLPDYEFFGTNLLGDDYLMLERRVYEIAATNPHLTVTLNGKEIKFRSFFDFAKMIAPEPKDVVCFGDDDFQVAVFPSDDGFKHMSYINSTCVAKGGTQIAYVMNQIVGKIRDHIKRKTKRDIKPAEIQSHFHLLINATIDKPRYNSQTKEHLETLPSRYGTTLSVTDAIARRIINSPIVASIIEWAENQKLLEDAKEAREKAKEASKKSLRDIDKYEPAISKNRSQCMLFVCEGESAANPLLAAADKNTQGIYELKGKPLNVTNLRPLDIIKNKEISDLIRILGLEVGVKADVKKLRYGKFVIAVDADLDGYHLASLLLNVIYRLWPELLEQGFVYQLMTPIIRATYKRKEYEFMTQQEFDEWAVGKTGYVTDYLKGLGSSDTKYFRKYLSDEAYLRKFTPVTQEDGKSLDLAFRQDMADERKAFLYNMEQE